MSPRHQRLIVDIFGGVVVASVGIALAGLVWRLAGDPGRRLGAAPIAARAGRPVDLAPLIALAPFGTGGGAGGATQAADQSLQLKGIIMGIPRERSSALVSIGGAAPVAVLVGQALGPGVVEAIERDHVVILAGGARQILAFPDPAAIMAASAANFTAPAPGSPPAEAAAQPAPAPGTTPAPPPPPAAAPPQGDPSVALAALGATATAGGYRVGDSLSPQLRLSGLQPGDVIERINGTPVGDASRDRTLLATAMGAGAARLDVLRAGQRLTLTLSLR